MNLLMLALLPAALLAACASFGYGLLGALLLRGELMCRVRGVLFLLFVDLLE